MLWVWVCAAPCPPCDCDSGSGSEMWDGGCSGERVTSEAGQQAAGPGPRPSNQPPASSAHHPPATPGTLAAGDLATSWGPLTTDHHPMAGGAWCWLGRPSGPVTPALPCLLPAAAVASPAVAAGLKASWRQQLTSSASNEGCPKVHNHGEGPY